MDSLFSNQRWFLAAVLGGVVLLLLLGTLGAREPSADDNAAAEVRRQRLAERDRLAGQAREIQQAGKPAEAIEALESVLALEREVFGAVHEECAGTLEWIASIEEARGDFTVARRRLEEAQQIQVKLHGTGHWRVTDARRALEDLNRRERLTPERRGQLREARNLNSRVVGLYHAGRFGEAIPLAERALEIRRGVLGEDHPDYATSLKNLADLYDSMGEPVAAEPLYRQAMKIVQKALGEDHPDHAAILNNLAVLYQSKGEYAKAEPLYRQALRVARKVLGEDHPQYAAVLNDLALHYDSMGEYAAAEPLYRQALEIQRKSLGEDHPHYAQSLVNLAALYAAVGESKKAEPLCRRALEIRRQALDTTFAVLSERQQFQMSRLFRGALDLYLSLSTRTNVHPARTHEALLAWKGAVFARQARDRLHGRDPESAGLLAELESASRRLGTLSFSVPGPKQRAAWRRQIGELTEKREELERALSRKSAAYREVRAAERLTSAELQRSLPEGVTLIDVMEYSRSTVTEKDGRRSVLKERCLAAFLIPAEGEMSRVELGPSTPITAAIESWRTGIRGQDAGKAGQELRRLLWEPLAKHLGAAKTILLSPDGPLHRLPLAALPGKTPGAYLLEEISVAVIPVPRLLPGLLARTPDTEGRESLLLVGDVDYGRSPGRASGPQPRRLAAGTITGALPEFRGLDATRAEILAIRDSFETKHEDGEVKVLRRGKATEEAFRAEAPKHRWLHLATHGFFAPPRLRSALANVSGDRFGETKVVGYHPGLLSGLALSGANTPPEADGDDGILTALEVASLDLEFVEVAVLSACETGLGEVAGGEGVLGLQRAFQVAGARTTVTSLWQVPDVPTQLLMQRFYENLWDKGTGKLEALREAQLFLMREGGRRGLGLKEGEAEGETKRLSPFYWAGFVLSGDWR